MRKDVPQHGHPDQACEAGAPAGAELPVPGLRVRGRQLYRCRGSGQLQAHWGKEIEVKQLTSLWFSGKKAKLLDSGGEI